MTDPRQRIADAFKRHFTHFGFRKTSVDEVAKELKMSKKTIYQFFSTKEKIFFFIISQAAQGYSRKMERDIREISGARGKLEELIRLIFRESRRWVREGNDAFEFKYKYEIASLAFRDAYSGLFERLLNEGIEEGVFRVSRPELTLQFIQGIFSEAMKVLQSDTESPVEDEVMESVRRLVGAEGSWY
ncbi:MAG: TetR/AcrR family transcriptional regulator [Bacteroidales bacterium]|nr:TetR/AcrR family transcriptional regulator [Bacteroidales bacterium]